jgi:hypothetical protein
VSTPEGMSELTLLILFITQMTTSINQITNQSFSSHYKVVDNFKRYMQHLRVYRVGLQTLVEQGAITESTMENGFEDYLNDTVGLFIDEYLQIETINIEYWEQQGLGECSKGSTDYNYASISDISNIPHLVSDMREVISLIGDLQDSLNDLADKSLLNEDDARDILLDQIHSCGLDYGSYGEMHEIDWVVCDD